jgi:hypothetical protein
VGANGIVYAEDIQPQMLESTMRRVAREGLGNVRRVLGAAEDPRLPARSLDAVLIVDTYHELDNPDAMLRNISTSLKPQGRVGVVDFKRDGLGPGPPLEDRVDPDQVVGRFGCWPWLVRREMLRLQFLLVFAPRPAPRAWLGSGGHAWRRPARLVIEIFAPSCRFRCGASPRPLDVQAVVRGRNGRAGRHGAVGCSWNVRGENPRRVVELHMSACFRPQRLPSSPPRRARRGAWRGHPAWSLRRVSRREHRDRGGVPAPLEAPAAARSMRRLRPSGSGVFDGAMDRWFTPVRTMRGAAYERMRITILVFAKPTWGPRIVREVPAGSTIEDI